jgi:hypothetical protein
MNHNRKLLTLFAMVGVLVLASGLRLWRITVGYDQVCLLPREELWLYEASQPTSLYNYDVSPVIYDTEVAHVPYTRTALPAPMDLLMARLIGAFGGIVAVALMIGYGRLLHHRAGWLAGLWLAAAPWFVWTDHWAIRFDWSMLAVAVAITGLAYQVRHRDKAAAWVRPLIIGSAVSLLLLAPPLWWLMLILLLLEFHFDAQKELAGRWALFFVFSGVLFIPALRSPMHWISAALIPDLGTTAAVLWGGTALFLWHWRQIRWIGVTAGLLLILVSGAFTVFSLVRISQPTAAEWELVNYLQAHIPDGSLVRFDGATWPLVDAVQCPAQQDVRFTAQPQEIPRAYLPGVHLHPAEPDYIVMNQSGETIEAPFTQQIGPYTVARMLPLPHSTDILFGDLVRLVGYDVLTPHAPRGQLVELRIDLQFAPQLNERILAYSAFVHITKPNSPGDKIINIDAAFINMLDVVGSRRLVVGRRLYAIVPPETPAGLYDVLFGVYNVYDGQRAGSVQGDAILIGQIEVVE